MLRLVLDTDLVWMLHSNLLAVYGLLFFTGAYVSFLRYDVR